MESQLEEVWICARIENTGIRPVDWLRKKLKVRRWHIQGVFDSEQKACAACADEWYFVGSLPLNVALPHVATEWPGAYFPMRKMQPPASFKLKRK